MFDDGAAYCRQPAVHAQAKPKSGKDGTRDNAPLLQHAELGDHENESEGETHEYECLVAKYTGSLAAFTRWLVFATFLLALFGFWQVMVSRNTARQQLRAYVFATDVKVLQFPTIPRITASFKNFGQTPCDNVTFSYDIQVSSFPIVNDLRIIPALHIAPIAPGSGFHRDNSFAVTPEQRGAITGGNAAIYIFGRIEYRDVFKGLRRHTNFRLVYTGDQFGRTGATEEGNDYS